MSESEMLKEQNGEPASGGVADEFYPVRVRMLQRRRVVLRGPYDGREKQTLSCGHTVALDPKYEVLPCPHCPRVEEKR